MNAQELMSILVDKEDELLHALIKSVREIRYGKDFEYFNSTIEVCAILKYLYELTEQSDNKEWHELKYIYSGLKDEFDLEKISFDDLEKYIFEHIKILINLLANVYKAKESLDSNKLKIKTIQEEL